MKTVKNVRHKFPQLKMTSLNVRLTVQNPKIINLESYLNRGEQNSWNASRLTETDWGMFWRLTAVPVDPHFSRLQPTLFTFFRSTWFHSFCYLTRWVVLFWLFWFCMFCHIVLRLHWLSSPVVLSHRFWRLVLRWCCPDVWFCPPHPELHWLCSPTSLQLFQVLSSSCWFCHSVLCCGGFGLTLLVSFCRVLQVLLFLQWCPLGLWFCPLHLELHWLCSWMILFCRLGSVVVLFSRFCPLVAGSVLWLFCGSLVSHLVPPAVCSLTAGEQKLQLMWCQSGGNPLTLWPICLGPLQSGRRPVGSVHLSPSDVSTRLDQLSFLLSVPFLNREPEIRTT